MMKDEKQMMKDDMVTKLAILLINDHKALTISNALNTVINSETYQRLIDSKTALYYQSPRYVYDFLLNDLRTGKNK